MPVNIMIGLLALLVALVLYSWGTWGAFRAKTPSRRHLVMLWVGFVFDVLATAMMAIQIGGIGRDLHTVVAFIGMGGMFLGAVFGTWGQARQDEKVQAVVARWVLAPWAVWVFVFVWGMLERGSKRMGG